VLVDGGSKDNTMEVIGAWQEVLPITFAYRPFDTPGKQKNYALHHCSGEWVLAIDADHTFGTNMGQIYASGYFKSHPIWDFRVYVCVVVEFMYVLWMNVILIASRGGSMGVCRLLATPLGCFDPVIAISMIITNRYGRAKGQAILGYVKAFQSLNIVCSKPRVH